MDAASNNLHMRLMCPVLNTCTDDSNMFVFRGKANNSNRWYLASKKYTGKQVDKQLLYSNDIGGTDHLNGLRVRITVTLNDLGLITAPFISVTGCKRRSTIR